MTLWLAGLRAGWRQLWPGWPRASLRSYVVAVALVGTVPLALLLSFQIHVGVREQQTRLDHELERMSGALAKSVERELMSTAEALDILAGNDLLLSGQVEAFQASLLRPRRLRSSWAGAFLIDADGRVLFDTTDPTPGAGSGEAGGVDFRQVLSSQRPVVSNLVTQPGRAGWSTAVAVPVWQGGRVRFVLGAWIVASTWQALLDTSMPPRDGFLTLFDRDHRVIARTQAADRWMGQLLPAATVALMEGQVKGVHRATSLDGAAVQNAWRVVGLGQWGTQVAIRNDALDLAQNRAVLRALAAAAGCLLLGLSLALLLARRLVEPLGQLAREGDDTSRPASPVPVIEIESLRERLRASRAEQATARARLETKAAEFEALFEGSPIALAFAQDKQCRVIVHNPAMDALFGRHPVQPGAMPDTQLTVLHDGRPLPREQQPLQLAARSGKAVPAMELEVGAPGQAPSVVLAQAVPLFDAQGQPRGAIGAAADITPRKHAEALLLEADRQLRESQRLVELAQEAGHVGFFSYDFEDDSLKWSPGLARLFEIDAAAISLDRWLARIDPEHRVHMQEQLRLMLSARQEKGRLDYRILLPDDAARWLSSRVLVQYGDANQARCMLGVTMDVSEQMQIERERANLVAREQAARIEAERANKAKDEFLAMLGHELRNPLGAISSAVEVLGSPAASPAQAANAREIAARQTRNLSRMLDDVLDVARVVAGKVMLSRQPLELGSLIGRLVETLRLGGSAHEHELVLDLQAAWVDADATRLEQVVTNLLTNALKYTPPGSRIELTLRHEGDSAVLTVRDNGPGIDADLLPRVFGLFVQGQRSFDRRIGGLGVGLTLAQRLVELHGGTLSAESSGAGAVFEVRLPALETPPGHSAPAAPVEAQAPAACRHIVLIEDNTDAARALQTRLELDGHQVQAAHDGVSGLELLLGRWPDAAIVDLGLPRMTGFEVALRSRAAGFPGLMVAISGYGQQADMQRALRSGFDALLVKPVDLARLRGLLAGPP